MVLKQKEKRLKALGFLSVSALSLAFLSPAYAGDSNPQINKLERGDICKSDDSTNTPRITLCREQLLQTMLGADMEADTKGKDDIGAQHIAAGHYGLALSYYLKEYQKDQKDLTTLNGLAVAYDKIGRFDLSKRFYAEALKQDPQDQIALNNLGYSLLLQRRPHDALTVLSRISKNASKPAQTNQNMSLALKVTQSLSAQNMESDPHPMLVRISHNAQKLVTKPNTDFIRAAMKADVDPRLVTKLNTTSRPPVIRIVTRSTAQSLQNSLSPKVVKQASPLHASLEISNGAGVTGMAARMRSFLKQDVKNRARLTNAVHFGFDHSTLFYAPGQKKQAEQLKARLPFSVQLIEQKAMHSDLRLRLGRDARSFDTQLQREAVLNSYQV